MYTLPPTWYIDTPNSTLFLEAVGTKTESTIYCLIFKQDLPASLILLLLQNIFVVHLKNLINSFNFIIEAIAINAYSQFNYCYNFQLNYMHEKYIWWNFESQAALTQ